MSKTLKQILDQVNDEIGFDLPAAYIGNVDPDIRQLVAIANKSALTLRDLRLQDLIRQAFIHLGSGGTVDLNEDPDGRISYWPFPADFYAAVPDTSYQNGRIDMAEWPTPATDWAYLISRTGPQTLRVRVRTMRDRIYVFSPDASQSLQFEYISKYPITVTPSGTGPQPSASQHAERFTSDRDTWDLDDTLIEKDIMMRYKRAKGLDYGPDAEDLRLYINELRGRDQNATTIRYPWSYPWPGQPYANLWVGT